MLQQGTKTAEDGPNEICPELNNTLRKEETAQAHNTEHGRQGDGKKKETGDGRKRANRAKRGSQMSANIFAHLK